MEAPSLDFSSPHASHCARFGWSCPSQGGRWSHLPSRSFYRLREPLIVVCARIILRSPCYLDSLSPVEAAPDMPDQPPAPGMRTRSTRKPADDYESLSQTETTPTQASQDCEDCVKRHTTCAPSSNNAATSSGDDSSLGRRQQSVHTPYLSPLSTNRHSADSSQEGPAGKRRRSGALFPAKIPFPPIFSPFDQIRRIHLTAWALLAMIWRTRRLSPGERQTL